MFFPTGLWYEGGVGAFRDNLIPTNLSQATRLFQSNFAAMAAQGINAVVAPNLPPTHHRALLDACGKNGIRAIIEMDALGGTTAAMIRGKMPFSEGLLRAALDVKLKPDIHHPALWRLQLIDEPRPDGFTRYAAVADVVRSYTGGRIGPFSCLIGSGDFEGFLRTTRSDVAAFDFYPLTPKTPPGDRGPLDAFADASRRAVETCRAQKADAWAVIQAHSIPGGLRFPTPEEIRCMTYLALAAGCQGIWWFLYQTEWIDKARGIKMSGLVDENYRGDQRWAEVGSLTRTIAHLAPILTELQPVPAEKAATVLAADSSQPPVPLWQDRSGGIYTWLVNRDTLATQPMALRLQGSVHLRRLPAGYLIPTNRDGGATTATDQLAPGMGGLYRIEPA